MDVAKKLAKGGVIEREIVLRAEVALAQAHRALDVADEAKAIVVAGLNLAIGLNVSAPTGVVDTADIPPFKLSLADCLQTDLPHPAARQRQHRQRPNHTLHLLISFFH